MKKIFQLINQNIKKISLFSTTAQGKKTDNRSFLPVITISREKRAGGRTIAYLLAKKLGKSWKVYHREIIDEIAKKKHLEKKVLEEIDERKISLADQLLKDIFGKDYLTLNRYHRFLVSIIAKISQRGKVIIVGRGAEFIVPKALKIRIIGEFEQRIKWCCQYDKLTPKEARKKLLKFDKERNEFIKTLYRKDPNDPHHYDLIIKTKDNQSLKKAVEIIFYFAKLTFGKNL